MPTQEQTVADAIEIFESASYPTGLSAETAWLGIYQTLLWYEDVNWVGFDALPHIIDANQLRPSPSQRTRWKRPQAWQKRAQAVERYLAQELECKPEEVRDRVDRLMRKATYEGLQRQNPLGIAFAGLIKHVLERLGNPNITYELEVSPESRFPGIQFPGRSRGTAIDMLASSDGQPCAIISVKWSVRHDRVNDITNECPIYKAAYERIYRGLGRHLVYYVLTNEYSPARLTKMLADTCIDGVVHVHKKAVTAVCQLDKRLEEMLDLSEFISLTHQW